MNLKFFWIVFGVFTMYFLFATMQEKLLKGVYGENEKFTYVMPLLCINSIVSYLYTLVFKVMNPYSVDKPIPKVLCGTLGLLSVLAMSSSFMALQWVSYPAQVLAKSSKPIPVLLMGVLLGDRSYPVRKYCIVFLIVFGVSAFFYNSKKAASSSVGIGIGEVLLIMSLLMDGFLNSLQERIMSKYKPNSNYLMMESNKWIIILSFLLTMFSGEAVKCFNFIQRYPSTLPLIFGMSLCGALGQYFIYKGIIELGTLTVSLITTTRKFFTVLCSIIIFGHHIVLKQWIAIICVFSGLLLDTYFGKGVKKTVTK